MMLLSKTAFCRSYLIHTTNEYDSISSMLKPGDDVVIANGTYTSWSLNINCNGTAEKPILFRAEKKGKVIFSGDVEQTIFNITGSYIILQNITFTGCNILKANGHNGILVDINNAKHSRLSNCIFTKNEAKSQFMPLVVVSGNGEYNRVDHCSFSENINNQEMQVRIAKEEHPLYTLIDNNDFKNKDKVTWKNFNGGECVQVGQDPILLGYISSYTTVRENTFTKCKAEPEVISNKCSNNFYVKNKFEDCDGELVMRGGNDCLIDSNIISGGNCGIRVNGIGHTISHNKINNVTTAIRLMYGMAAGKTTTGFYIAASDCKIEFNHITNVVTGLLIGDSKNADWTGKFDTKRYPSRMMQDVAPLNNNWHDNVFVKTQNEIVQQ